MRRSSIAVVLLLSAACAHGPRREGPGVLLAPAELARQTGLEPWAISMPFGKNQDGTELVLKFLASAEASGARFVSDMQVVFVAEEDGQPLECRTRLVPKGTAKDAPRGIRTAKAESKSPGLKLVRRTIIQPEYACTETSTRVVQTETYTDPLRSSQQSSRSVAQSQPGAPRCGYRNVSRLLTRFSFEDAVNYLPPSIQRIRDARPELKLEETDAECVPRDPQAPAVNRIEALAYGGAGPRAAMPAAPEALPTSLDL
jgi:hypothetical protein